MDMEKDEIEMLSKVINGLYKKLVILVAISAGVGAYQLSSCWMTTGSGIYF